MVTSPMLLRLLRYLRLRAKSPRLLRATARTRGPRMCHEHGARPRLVATRRK